MKKHPKYPFREFVAAKIRDEVIVEGICYKQYVCRKVLQQYFKKRICPPSIVDRRAVDIKSMWSRKGVTVLIRKKYHKTLGSFWEE